MAGPDANRSPLEVAAGAADPKTLETFELLADETRLAILLALWDEYEPFVRNSGVPFSELRERVGNPDSGKFNYHLGKLTGEVVRATDDGYKLRPGGEKIVRAVIGEAGRGTSGLPPTQLGMDCPRCDAPTAVTYRDGRLFERCTECEGYFAETDDLPAGTLYTWQLEPVGLVDRTPEQMYAAAAMGMLQQTMGMIEGVCPSCSGLVESEVEICEEHEVGPDDVCPSCGLENEISTLFQCSVCKLSVIGPPSGFVTHHPAVVAFYYERGVETQYSLDFEGVRQVLEVEEAHEQSLVSTEPVRIRVTVAYEGDERSLLLDDELRVLDVSG
ncbi:hypothetical protein BRC64_10080 [Halobacteriales archaeon QH_10_67_22]|nr:MAG: hypothetical protein BRC64_10080 [Halobacteriales archaeon QH_10_67_22]